MRDHRWYDPHHEVMEGDNTYYAEGAFYAVSGRLTDGIINSGLIPRLGGSEGNSPAALSQILGDFISLGLGRESDYVLYMRGYVNTMRASPIWFSCIMQHGYCTATLKTTH
jgi:hypothetical protein